MDSMFADTMVSSGDGLIMSITGLMEEDDDDYQCVSSTAEGRPSLKPIYLQPQAKKWSIEQRYKSEAGRSYFGGNKVLEKSIIALKQ